MKSALVDEPNIIVPLGIYSKHIGWTRVDHKAMGRGQRQVCDTDKFGFRRKKKNGEFNAPRLVKRIKGFQTGDMAKVKVPIGKYAGNYLSRIVSVRKTGAFSIRANGKIFGVNPKYCQIVHRSDGYDYNLGEAFASA